jgi:hypothetical protein
MQCTDAYESAAFFQDRKQPLVHPEIPIALESAFRRAECF